MSKFSVGMTLNEIQRELSKAVITSLKNIDEKPREAFTCLVMLDKILPQNLDKLLRLVQTKYSVKKEIKEIAAIKCIVDLRIKLYKALGG